MLERKRHSEAIRNTSLKLFVSLTLAVGAGAAAHIYDYIYAWAAAGALGIIAVNNGLNLIDKVERGPRS